MISSAAVSLSGHCPTAVIVSEILRTTLSLLLLLFP
jgi:hypothetical protein